MIKRYNNTKFKSVFDWFQCDWKVMVLNFFILIKCLGICQNYLYILEIIK